MKPLQFRSEPATRLKVGLIGCGRIAQAVHLETLRRLPGVELTAHADPDPQRREEVSRRVPASRPYAGFEDLLDSKDLHAVVICAPTALHAKIATHALERGRHIYLEKPLATTLAEADVILKAWRASGVVGMIGLNSRFLSLYPAARQALAAGHIGDLVCARTALTTPLRDLSAWRQRRDTGGGVLLDLAVHHFDLVRFLFGQEVREVFANLHSRRSQDDLAMVHLVLENGIPVQSTFTYGTVAEDRFEIYGQEGALLVDRHRSLTVEIRRRVAPPSRVEWLRRGWRALPGIHAWGQKLLAPTRDPSYEAALAAFVCAARAGRPVSPDLWDGYQSLAIASAAEQSASTKCPASLERLSSEDLTRH